MRTPERQDMIMRHMPLVAFVVGRMSTDNQKTLGLDREDALAYGTEGLIQAVDAFDLDRGTSFASFAVRRIRGSILDAIRKMDPLPRSLRKSTREVEQTSQELAASLGRWPTSKEIAFRLGMPADQIQGIMRHAGSKFISLEHAIQDRGGEHAPSLDPVDEDETGDPAKAADHNASLAMLDGALHELNARDRAILKLRYGESKPFHVIGDMLGLSESRVCQLHKRILSTLRRQLVSQLEEAA
ncbi:MAG: sigma-70 family RNA polymerase sigma factor [Dehalococcoidia bacterium]|nr:sigma-70 family RNA polymerase sigma factor [Dehalococcoidia bacterium]